MKKSLVRAALAAAVTAAVATGCAGGGSTETTGDAGSRPETSTSQQQSHNEADVTFVREMIPHHLGAIEMARLTEGRTGNPEILDLAHRIEQAQGPEIEQLRDWLRAWGADGDMPGMDPGDMGHGGMGHAEMPGMGAEDMRRLEQANGAEFDRLFLELMIEHHQGAVDMSETVLAEGSDPRVADLAQRIVDAQEAEIAEMRSLLED